MLFHFGIHLCGKVDRIPGGVYVATSFLYILCMPIIPIDSYIVIRKTFAKWDGVKIPFCWRSILKAYFRGVLWVLLLSSVIVAIAANGTPGGLLFGISIIAAMAVLVIASQLLWLRASPKRMLQICERLGIDPNSVVTPVDSYAQAENLNK